MQETLSISHEVPSYRTRNLWFGLHLGGRTDLIMVKNLSNTNQYLNVIPQPVVITEIQVLNQNFT